MSEQEVTLDDFSESDGEEGTATTTEGLSYVSYPPDWEVVSFKEVFEDIRYGTDTKSNTSGEGYPTLRIPNVVGKTITTADLKYTPLDDEEAERIKLEEGDIVLVRTNGNPKYVGQCAVFNCEVENAVFASYLIRVRIEQGTINPRFVSEFLNSHLGRKEMAGWISTSAGNHNLGISSIENFNLPVPPSLEQRQIASVLYTVDQAVQKTEEVIDQIKQTQKGIEKRLFREGAVEHECIEEKRLVTLPSDWDFDQLSEHTQHSAFGPRFGSERYDKHGNIATLRTTDLNDRGHITLESMPTTDLEIEEVEKHLLEPGDFMITRSGTTGIGTVWKGYDKPTIPGAFLIRFRLNDTLTPRFLKYYVNSSIGRQRVNRRAKGGVQKNLSGSDLLNMRFPIPSIEEQNKIVEILESIEEYIKSERRYKSQLQRLKQGLMQDLLSGEVRTTNADIEIPDEIAQHG